MILQTRIGLPLLMCAIGFVFVPSNEVGKHHGIQWLPTELFEEGSETDAMITLAENGRWRIDLPENPNPLSVNDFSDAFRLVAIVNNYESYALVLDSRANVIKKLKVGDLIVEDWAVAGVGASDVRVRSSLGEERNLELFE